jgi:release factor glutamine methyltransferase
MALRGFLKPLATRILQPMAAWYLRRPRKSHYQDVHLLVPPGVFHPGLFLSTRFMLKHLQAQNFKGQRFWEIGAGSGMVAIWAAKRGANVWATDISKTAFAAIEANAASNQVGINVILADLYDGMPALRFDWIVVNPPYYPKDPQTEAENAFFCGAEFQYFERFFAGLIAFVGPNAEIRMVLSEDCKLDKIAEIGERNGWGMDEVARMRKLGEWNFIYRIHPLA